MASDYIKMAPWNGGEERLCLIPPYHDAIQRNRQGVSPATKAGSLSALARSNARLAVVGMVLHHAGIFIIQ